jgi:hypothetical protein
MMLYPWMLGLEALQQGWQAQSALAFRLMRSFAGGVPDQTASSPLSPDTVADDLEAQGEVAASVHVRGPPAAIGPVREAPAAVADAPRRKGPGVLPGPKRVLPAPKKTSHARARSVSKRAAAASQNSARKAVRRSARKPR